MPAPSFANSRSSRLSGRNTSELLLRCQYHNTVIFTDPYWRKHHQRH